MRKVLRANLKEQEAIQMDSSWPPPNRGLSYGTRNSLFPNEKSIPSLILFCHAVLITGNRPHYPDKLLKNPLYISYRTNVFLQTIKSTICT